MIDLQITFTQAAQAKLQPILSSTHKKLKFLHDSEGCGCVVNGISALELIDSPSIYDVEGIADPFPFYYDSSHKVYYEDHMKIDYNTTTNSFILKSDSQIYNSHIRLIQ